MYFIPLYLYGMYTKFLCTLLSYKNGLSRLFYQIRQLIIPVHFLNPYYLLSTVLEFQQKGRFKRIQTVKLARLLFSKYLFSD